VRAITRTAIVRAQKAAHRKLARGLGIFQAKVPDLEGARRFVSALEDATADLNRAAGLSGSHAALVSESVLQNTLPLYIHLASGHLDVASHFLFHTWADYVETYRAADRKTLVVIHQAKVKSSVSASQKGKPTLASHVTKRARGWLMTCQLAVQERLLSEMAEDRSASIIRRFKTALGLSQDEVGRMLHVNGETVRRWEKGLARVTPERAAALESADAALIRLTEVFLPDALPRAVRRPAELFGGRRALDLILEGGIREVADRYQLALSYQG
jgi:transcriptional regulator with XRE-family HTH domain